MKKSVEYLTSLYREFGDNAQKALDFIEKNVNDCADNREGNICDDNGERVVAVPVPLLFDKERVLIFDADKEVFVDKDDVDNHDNENLEVVVIHQNGAFIVSKHDTEKFSLETKNPTNIYVSEECKAVFDFDGKENTELLIKAGLYIELPKGTYIPALGEKVVMCRNIEEVNECLKLVGGDELDMDSYYWTSSEKSRGHAWYVYFTLGSLSNLSKGNLLAARPVSSFTFKLGRK